MKPNQFDRLAQLVGCALSRRRLLAATTAWIISKQPNTPVPQLEISAAKRKKNRGTSRAKHQSEAKRKKNRGTGAFKDQSETISNGHGSAAAKRPKLGSLIPPLPDGTFSCALQPYNTDFAGSRFKGSRIILSDVQFHRRLDQINTCANAAGIDLVQGSSYRGVVDENWDIYKRIKWNNHVPGHAQDFLSIGGCGWETRDTCAAKIEALIKKDPVNNPPPPNGESVKDYYCPRGGGCLSQDFDDYPEGVQKFINCIEHTPGLKWGGRFGDGFDPIHIDDRWNHGVANAYDKFPAYQERAQLAAYSQLTSPECPEGMMCDVSTGRCVPRCDVDCPDCMVCKDNECVPVDCGPCSECHDNACHQLDCDECHQCVDNVCVPTNCGFCSHCEHNTCVSDEPDCECAPISCPPGQEQDSVSCQCVCAECLDQYDQCFDRANDRASACQAVCSEDRAQCHAACQAESDACEAGCADGGSAGGRSGSQTVPPGCAQQCMNEQFDCDQPCTDAGDACDKDCLDQELALCSADYDACQAGCGAGGSASGENGGRQSTRSSRHQPRSGDPQRQPQHRGKRRQHNRAEQANRPGRQGGRSHRHEGRHS